MEEIWKLRERFDSRAFAVEYDYDGVLGALCGEEGTSFALWAPTAERVVLRLYASDKGKLLAEFPMTRGEKGCWRFDTAQILDGVYYDYDVTVDGETRRTADPYARACGANGLRSMVIDLSRTDPKGWETDEAPEKQCETIIYELHVKDFSWDAHSGVPRACRGKYRALTLDDTSLDGKGEQPTCVAYMKELGVTHVQLMPVYDFGSVDETGDAAQFNWGYDPVNYNIPEGSYSSDPSHGEVRVRELKEAVMALHKAGFRVIMDVVYNHTYRLDSCLFRTVPWYYYRQNADGSASNGSGCGSEIASERSMCARYILDSVMYWAEEYHMDGFRVDLMGMMDKELITRIQRALDERFGVGEKQIYGEPWSGGECHPRPGTKLCWKDEIRTMNERIGAFNDTTRDAIKGSLNPEARGFVNGGAVDAEYLAGCVSGWAGAWTGASYAAPSQTINYLSCHDDWTLWDKLVFTLDEKKAFAKIKPEVLRANRLAAAMLFCCQGNCFLLSGEEFGRTKQGIRNTYNLPLDVNQIDWTRLQKNKALSEYYRGLIGLRKTLPGLCDKSPDAYLRVTQCMQPYERLVMLRVDNRGAGSEYDELLMMFNCGERDESVILPEDEWRVLADGENSLRWQKPEALCDEAIVDATSALILGKKRARSGAKVK